MEWEKPVSKDFLCLQQTGGYKAVLHHELLRKNVDGYEVLSDTKIRYRCTLAENELANTYISEVGLYDADGDMVAMKAFLKKGKDADIF